MTVLADSAADARLRRNITWMRTGTEVLLEHARSLADSDLAQPSGLGGWTRGHLLAHVSLNASALINLLTWARTGVVTPMYPSREARSADIEANSTQPMTALLTGIEVTARRLDEAVATLPPVAWTAEIRTASGRAAPATVVPWMRVREVWVHTVDLEVGYGFADIPAAVLAALVEDMAAMMTPRLDGPPFAVLYDGAPEPVVVGRGTPQRLIDGPLADLVTWLSGRRAPAALGGADDLPALPVWL